VPHDRRSTLALLVLRILANDPDNAVSADDPAIDASPFD